MTSKPVPQVQQTIYHRQRFGETGIHKNFECLSWSFKHARVEEGKGKSEGEPNSLPHGTGFVEA
jgi:hypothetical protein